MLKTTEKSYRALYFSQMKKQTIRREVSTKSFPAKNFKMSTPFGVHHVLLRTKFLDLVHTLSYCAFALLCWKCFASGFVLQVELPCSSISCRSSKWLWVFILIHKFRIRRRIWNQWRWITFHCELQEKYRGSRRGWPTN